MIRKINIEDKNQYIAMSNDFYSSEAVLHSIPKENFCKTFDLLMDESPYVDGYIFEYNDEIA